MMNYHLKKNAVHASKMLDIKNMYSSQANVIKYDVSAEKAYIKRLIKDKVQKKIDDYEVVVEERRER